MYGQGKNLKTAWTVFKDIDCDKTHFKKEVEGKLLSIERVTFQLYRNMLFL